jgi:hypothetical protein
MFRGYISRVVWKTNVRAEHTEQWLNLWHTVSYPLLDHSRNQNIIELGKEPFKEKSAQCIQLVVHLKDGKH